MSRNVYRNKRLVWNKRVLSSYREERLAKIWSDKLDEEKGLEKVMEGKREKDKFKKED